MKHQLGVIGFGNIAKAIVTPLLKNKLLKPEEIFCLVRSKKSLEIIKNSYEYKINIFDISSDQADLIWDCPYKLLSVKPQQLNNIKEINKRNVKKSTIVSILAGVTIKKLEENFPNHNCVRAITNVPIIIGQGLTGISWNNKTDQKSQKFIRNIFSTSSRVYELSEDYLDVFLALTSSAPAIITLLIEALGDGGLSGGLQKELSEELVIEMILGTVLLLKDSKLSTADLRNMVTSPGGTTISALRVLEKNNFRSALMESIISATNRSKEFR